MKNLQQTQELKKSDIAELAYEFLSLTLDKMEKEEFTSKEIEKAENETLETLKSLISDKEYVKKYMEAMLEEYKYSDVIVDRAYYLSAGSIDSSFAMLMNSKLSKKFTSIKEAEEFANKLEIDGYLIEESYWKYQHTGTIKEVSFWKKGNKQ